MASDISSLPPEVLIRIFQFLKGGDRLKASQVCKKWLQTIDCPELLCEVKVQFSEKVDEAVKLFSRMTRQFQWFSFYKIVIGVSVIEFLEKYSTQLVTLFFIDCVVGDDKSKFKSKKLRFDNLTTLHVQSSNIHSLFASLPEVTELKLQITFNLSDYALSELTKCLFKLERLLLYINLSFEEVRFYIDEQPTERHLSFKTSTFSGIKLLIEKNRDTLRHVDFEFVRFSEQALLSISEIEGLKLRSMLFPRNLHSSYIHKFCEMQSSLIHLDLSFLLHDTDLTVCAVCSCLPNLQELIIRRTPIDQAFIKYSSWRIL
ncbi:hypothetical protein TNCT_595731 [Trichonephila clavata]|uniref:F-box domain-containing protein n=1 Tax=Trichonephila clavata TaxID=2740835 RepID=A0A8X6LUA2_TRICU|nr:hypothetical protein TNCT_595731 [Trichonephila clavata]